jgi:hypothetical protein
LAGYIVKRPEQKCLASGLARAARRFQALLQQGAALGGRHAAHGLRQLHRPIHGGARVVIKGEVKGAQDVGQVGAQLGALSALPLALGEEMLKVVLPR